ncbi:MAG: ribonuclease R [Flavobacteriales bacterium]|nr:ribonuclease R [Flavobacteriales bacterium]
MAHKEKGKLKDRQLRESIISVLSKDTESTYNYKQIASVLGIKDPFIRKRIVQILEQLDKDNVLKQVSRGKFKLKSSSNELEGTLQFVSRGGAYFICQNIEKDIFIHSSKLKNALNGDKVLVKTVMYKGKTEGQVIKVIERVKKEYIGLIEKSNDFYFLRPDDRSLNIDFYIDKKHLNGAKDGQKVKVKFLSWPKSVKSPQAAVVDVLGEPGELNVEMNSILAEFGFPLKFPNKVNNEADLIEEPNYNIEAKKRKDFRKTTTFTIDPVDAKDFDDALSYKELKNGNIEVGVHIADVGHYVKENSHLDREAFYRANSVYLVDRVIPMLPEKLSNKLCSLRPHEDKLTFSAVFELSSKGEVKNSWFGKTIIHSDHRFTYEEAQAIIEGEKNDLAKEVLALNSLAELLRKKRMEKGALNVESQEVRFQLDETGDPIGTILKESKAANKLIEEFMLLANKRVAMYTGKPEKDKLIKPSIYRIHDEPNPEKISDLKIFLGAMDYQIVREKNKPISFSLNKIMEKAKTKEELHLIAPMVIRSMSKAAYSTENIGHYGLAFEYYSHFTSPIRRYADLIVHRNLLTLLENKSKYQNTSADLNHQCKHLSKMEKQAVDAERASVKYMQVIYLSKQIGKQFEGRISGLTDWGMYIEINENKCEGMVPLKSMKDDQFYYDQEQQAVLGYQSRKSFKLGQEVVVVVNNTNLAKRQIDFKLIS